MKQKKLFCEYNPLFYAIAVQKNIIQRNLRNWRNEKNLASDIQEGRLPHIVKSHRSLLLRKLDGVEMELQQNKVTNLKLASARLDGVLIRPGEVFSFWHLVGKCTRRKGYLDGMTLSNGAVGKSVGGGMCQLANMIHFLVLNSPLTVTELHHHTDALFPDENRRVPFGTGTSIFYNYVDYRFANETVDTYQLVIWLDDTDICGELRCDREPEYRYKLVERNHHFVQEGPDYFRISQVYRQRIRRMDGELVEEELVLDNHSKVLYAPSLIPPDQLS